MLMMLTMMMEEHGTTSLSVVSRPEACELKNLEGLRAAAADVLASITHIMALLVSRPDSLLL